MMLGYSMEPFHLEIQYDRQLIQVLSGVQYDISQTGRKTVVLLIGIVCLLIGGRMIGQMAEPWNYFFIVYGCFSIVFINVPAKWRSERICAAIEKSGKGYPCSLFDFGDSFFTANTKGNSGKGDTYRYSECYRLVETRDGYFYFVNRDAAFPFPYSQIPEDQRNTLRSFLESKTGLTFIPVFSILSFSIKDILRRFR